MSVRTCSTMVPRAANRAIALRKISTSLFLVSSSRALT